jgi:hypothetical protein
MLIALESEPAMTLHHAVEVFRPRPVTPGELHRASTASSMASGRTRVPSRNRCNTTTAWRNTPSLRAPRRVPIRAHCCWMSRARGEDADRLAPRFQGAGDGDRIVCVIGHPKPLVQESDLGRTDFQQGIRASRSQGQMCFQATGSSAPTTAGDYYLAREGFSGRG